MLLDEFNAFLVLSIKLLEIYSFNDFILNSSIFKFGKSSYIIFLLFGMIFSL